MFMKIIICLIENIIMIQTNQPLTKDKTGGVAMKEFVGLKPKMYSFLVDDNSEHKEAKGVNKNVVATISHNEYKDVLLNNKCLRH